MKTVVLAIVLLGTQLAFGQDFNTYFTQDQKPYHVVTINPSNFGKGMIYGGSGNRIATYQIAIRSWMFQDSMQSFLDKNNNPLAQIRKENGKTNLYNNAGQLVHTFPAFSSLFALTQSDDIVMLHPKTFEIIDSYSFRVADLIKKVPNPGAFVSIGSHVLIVYDANGNFVKTTSIKSELRDSTVATNLDISHSYVASMP